VLTGSLIKDLSLLSEVQSLSFFGGSLNDGLEFLADGLFKQVSEY
jgi:hypothetical protein